MEKRIIWADYAKAAGIYLVILSHTMTSDNVKEWAYVFHMPLFFFISGYLFSFRRHKTWRGFALARMRQIMIPYLWFNLITYLMWLAVLRHLGSDFDRDIPWWSPAAAAAFGYGDKMVHDAPLWFFMCIYIVEITYYCVFKRLRCRWPVTAAFFAAGWAVYALCPVRLPFNLGTALVAMVFYAAGHEFRERREKTSDPAAPDAADGRKALTGLMRGMLRGGGFIMALAVTILVAHYNGRINMHMNFYNNYLLFFTGACAGIFMMYTLCSRLRRSAAVEFVSNNTLTICSVHLTVFAALKGIMLYALGISPGALDEKIFLNLVYAAVALAVSTGIAAFINRYLPFIAGKRRKTQK